MSNNVIDSTDAGKTLYLHYTTTAHGGSQLAKPWHNLTPRQQERWSNAALSFGRAIGARVVDWLDDLENFDGDTAGSEQILLLKEGVPLGMAVLINVKERLFKKLTLGDPAIAPTIQEFDTLLIPEALISLDETPWQYYLETYDWVHLKEEWITANFHVAPRT